MRTSTLTTSELTCADRDAMRVLLATYFQGVCDKQFEADLSDKSYAVLLHDDAGALVGFSTFAVYAAPGPDGELATIVCSGDTIVAPSAWGSSHLPSAWVQAVHAIHRRSGRAGLYWLLITSGYRTYRFLPVFVRAFVPSVDRGAPADLLDCMRRLARQRWGGQYDPADNVVRLGQPQPLCPTLAGIPDARRDDPHIAFFLQQNPGHAQGDELVSFASLGEDNLTRAGLRMLRQRSAVAHAGAHD